MTRITVHLHRVLVCLVSVSFCGSRFFCLIITKDCRCCRFLPVFQLYLYIRSIHVRFLCLKLHICMKNVLKIFKFSETEFIWVDLRQNVFSITPSKSVWTIFIKLTAVKSHVDHFIKNANYFRTKRLVYDVKMIETVFISINREQKLILRNPFAISG